MGFLQLHGLVPRETSTRKGGVAHEVLPCGLISALISPFPNRQNFDELAPDAIAAWALKHHQVLLTYCADCAVLPTSVGAVFSSATAIQAEVAANADQYVKSLAALSRIKEYTLQLRAMGKPARPQAQSVDGRGFLKARRQQRDGLLQLDRRQRAMADDVLRQLKTLALQINPAGPTKAEQLINCAVLLENTSLTALRNMAKTLHSPCRAMDLDLVISGPWPPYSFDDAAFAGPEITHAC